MDLQHLFSIWRNYSETNEKHRRTSNLMKDEKNCYLSEVGPKMRLTNNMSVV